MHGPPLIRFCVFWCASVRYNYVYMGHLSEINLMMMMMMMSAYIATTHIFGPQLTQ